MHWRFTKLTPHWFSSIPKRYKRNVVHGDLYRAERISSGFNNGNILIRQKFDYPGHPSPFTNSVIRDYEHKQNKRQDQKDEYIIPLNFFEIVIESILVEFPYCPQNKLFFFLSNDLHISQITCITSKNRTQNTIWKLNNTSTEPYVLSLKAIRLLKQKKCKNWFLSINLKYTPGCLRMVCGFFLCIYLRLREQINKKTNKQKVQVCAIFSYISGPLNLSDFKMNLIENFNIL